MAERGNLYKVLRVPHTASIKEIKSSYRKLALRFHPDTNDGNTEKTAEFRRISEAYAILSDEQKKSRYDIKMGLRYNRNRRMPPPPNYRSVEFPKPPKHWKMVWDHKLHHDMHYGDGLYEHIIRKAKRKMEKEGKYQYQSPLGPGFTFSKDDPKRNHNPYSTDSPQGPPRVEFVFEEYGFGSTLNDVGKKAKDNLQRHVRVVENLHGRREQRREYQTAQKKKQEQKKKENAAFTRNAPQDGSCVIL